MAAPTADPSSKLARIKTNVRLAAMTLAALIVGAAIAASADPPKWWPNILLALGSGIIAVGALSLVAEVSVRRTLREELLVEVHTNRNFERVGLIDAVSTTRDLTDQFTAWISTARKIDLMFVSDSTWLDNHIDGLREFLDGGGRLRVLLPKEGDRTVVAQLLKRFDVPDSNSMRSSIVLAKQRVLTLQGSYPALMDAAGRLTSGVELRSTTTIPTYSYYRMDDHSVLRMQEIQKDQVSDTPVLVCSRAGTFWKFANNDFDAVFDEAVVDA